MNEDENKYPIWICLPVNFVDEFENFKDILRIYKRKFKNDRCPISEFPLEISLNIKGEKQCQD